MFQQQIPEITKNTGIQVRIRPSVEFPLFELPQLMGSFSIFSKYRIYQPDKSQLRYFVPPSAEAFPLNLNFGMERIIRKSESVYSERSDNLLTFIFDNFARLNNQKSENQTNIKLSAAFVCLADVLKLIMCTPFESKEDWYISVIQYRGTCYLCKMEVEHQNQANSFFDMESSVFKLQQYVLSDSSNERPCVDKLLDENCEFYCVFTTSISGLNILYGSKMDGVIRTDFGNTKFDLNNPRFVAIKIRCPNDGQNFEENVSRMWWCESFIVGIKDIFIGMQDVNGMIASIENVKVNTLFKIGEKYWTPAICVQFLVEFLSYIKKQTIQSNCPYTTTIYHFNAASGRILHRLVHGKTQYSFLPDWYINIFDKKVRKNQQES